MSEEKVTTALLKFGTPATISLLVVAIYNFVDAVFVGGIGTAEIGAVTVIFPMSIVIIGIGLTLGTGASSFISRLIGAGEKEKADRVLNFALLAGFIITLAAVAVSIINLDRILLFLGSTRSILQPAREYSYIFLIGSFFNVFNITLSYLMRAEGAMKPSLFAVSAGSILNIALDPLFIYTLEMGISGAAAASVLSQFVSTLLILHFYLSGKSVLSISLKRFNLDKSIAAEVFKVGLPSFIFQILTSITMGMINKAAAVYGETAIAAIGIVNRIYVLATYVVFGFSKGFQPLAGYSFGAGNLKRLKELKDVFFKWSLLFCIAVAVLEKLAAVPLVSLFTRDPEVIELGSFILEIYLILFPLFAYQNIYFTLFISIGRGKESMILSLAKQGFFSIPLLLFVPKIWGLGGLAAVQPISDALTVILTFIMSFRYKQLVKQ